MYKKANIVMLPSNEKAHFGDIVVTPDNKTLFIFQHQNCTEIAQHLYITSDEEIKAGCWFICNNAAQQCIRVIEGHDYPYEIKNKFNGEIQRHSKHWKGVIIATTDTSLKVINLSNLGENWKDISLPQPSKEFIEIYIKAYNKCKQITTIEIEYESMDISTMTSDTKTHPNLSIETLKINSDNTINIKPIKNNWSREDIIKLKNKLISLSKEQQFKILDSVETFDKWIEENL